MLAGLLIGIGGVAAGGGVAASLSNHTITRSAPFNPVASFQVRADGSVQNQTGSTLEAWLDAGTNTQFEIMVDGATGDGLTGGDGEGLWLSCSANRVWSLTSDTFGDSLSCSFRARIRNASTLAVLTTATITLISTNTHAP